MAPLVSFIIPSIGRKSLHTALDSVRHQTDEDYEVIVVADPRWQVWSVDDFDEKEFIFHGHQQSAGLLRNEGIAQAYGEWVAFLDDDDTIDPEYVENLRDHADDFPNADVIIFRMAHPEYGILPRKDLPIIAQGLVGISYAVKRKLNPGFIREEVLSKTDGKLNTHEDIELLERLRYLGHELYVSPHTNYYVGGNNK